MFHKYKSFKFSSSSVLYDNEFVKYKTVQNILPYNFPKEKLSLLYILCITFKKLSKS